ncbi:DUF397 domain-containing protein [Streptomyces sp. NPDC020917]|uniref:DUF397 domain-containing protein n=1 Tax=Streptomyces sp. NPDC020917 TaxID=3365102 RepID=UPI0037BC1CE7
MTAKPSAELHWFKSSYSSNEEPNCVEVASTPGTVHVRDSKDPDGPQLAFSPAAWTAFLDYAATAAEQI